MYFFKFYIYILIFLGALRVQAYFKDAIGERANSELLMLSHYSPFNKHIRVSTSTIQAKVWFLTHLLSMDATIFSSL